MSDETRTATEVKEERKEPAAPERGQVGASPVGPIGIVLMMAYLILFSILLLYGMMQFWPPATPTGEGAALTSSSVTFLLWRFSISDEVRLLLIVALAGALGSLVHVLRSLSHYVGERELERSWLPRYILLPFLGPTVALVFYFVIRGGFFSPQVTVQETSPYGFAALAGLVGMFSDLAMEKLREVAGTLLGKLEPEAEAEPREEPQEEPQEKG